MTERTKCKRLQVATELYQFIEREALPGTGVASDAFWSGFDKLVHDLAPKNRALIAQPDTLQAELDNRSRQNTGTIKHAGAYHAFLRHLSHFKEPHGSLPVNPNTVDTQETQPAEVP